MSNQDFCSNPDLINQQDPTVSEEYVPYTEDLEEEEPIVLEVYNHDLTLEENFPPGKVSKYICIKVHKNGEMLVMDDNYYESPLTGADKFILRADEYSQFDTYMVDYDTIFGTRFLRFMQYNDVFDCQERVFFEALLIKFKKSDFKNFYWSKTKIKDELGIKPDKAESIIKRFKKMGFLKTALIKSMDEVKKRPQQVTYFTLDAKKVIEILPSLYKEDAEYNFPLHRDIIKYLTPALKKENPKGKKYYNKGGEQPPSLQSTSLSNRMQ